MYTKGNNLQGHFRILQATTNLKFLFIMQKYLHTCQIF